MSWDYSIHDTITGVLQAPVTLADNSMGRAINTGERGTSRMYPQEGVSRAGFHDLTTPWARMLVKSRNGKPVASQMITGHNWDFTRNCLNLRHADAWAILGRRSTFGTNGYSGDQPTDNRMEMVNFSLKAMIPYLLWSGTEGPTSNFELPIWLPEGKLSGALIELLPHAGPDKRTYWDYEVHFLDDAIEEVMTAENGPDVDIEPRFSSSGNLELHARIGTLTGGTSDWMMSSAEPGLFDVDHDEDAMNQANVVYAIGKGEEADMRVRSASAASAPNVPALELAKHYDTEDLNDLQSHANADLALHNRTTHQWGASMFASAGLGIENMPLAHTMRLSFTDHPWEPDGFNSQRLIGFGTQADDKVTLTLQSIGG